MDLPNKKQWAVYYKTIKNPQCLENIFVRHSFRYCYDSLLIAILEKTEAQGVPYSHGFRERC